MNVRTTATITCDKAFICRCAWKINRTYAQDSQEVLDLRCNDLRLAVKGSTPEKSRSHTFFMSVVSLYSLSTMLKCVLDIVPCVAYWYDAMLLIFILRGCKAWTSARVQRGTSILTSQTNRRAVTHERDLMVSNPSANWCQWQQRVDLAVSYSLCSSSSLMRCR